MLSVSPLSESIHVYVHVYFFYLSNIFHMYIVPHGEAIGSAYISAYFLHHFVYWHTQRRISSSARVLLYACVHVKRFLNQLEFSGPPQWSAGCRPSSVRGDWIEILFFSPFFLGGGLGGVGGMLMKGWLIWCQALCDGLNCVCRRGPGQSWLLLPFPPATAAAALRKFDFRSSETHGSPFLSAAWLPFSLRVHKWFFIGWNLRRIG